MNKLYYIFFFVALAACCKHKHLIEYDSDSLNNVTCEFINEITLNDKHFFGDPTQLSIVNDTTLVVLDRADNGYIAHLFSTDGRYITGFGKLGQGPSEFLLPENISVSLDNKHIYIYDFRLATSNIYTTDSLLHGYDQCTKMHYNDISVDGLNRFEAVFHQTDRDYICLGFTDKCRINSIINGKIKQIYTDYPPLIDNAEHNRSAWNNGSKHSMSPDGKHIVYATWIGMAFEILNNDNGNIQSKLVKGFHEPKYDVAQGAIPVCIYSSKDCFEGFRTICATNDGFYGCVSGNGPDYDEGNIIYFFDYNGNLKRKIEITSIIDCISVLDNTLFALVHNDNSEVKLIKLEL